VAAAHSKMYSICQLNIPTEDAVTLLLVQRGAYHKVANLAIPGSPKGCSNQKKKHKTKQRNGRAITILLDTVIFEIISVLNFAIDGHKNKEDFRWWCFCFHYRR